MRVLAFILLGCAVSTAAALDSTRYFPLKTGYEWAYKNMSTGATSTSKVGSPIALPSGVLAFPVVGTSSDYPLTPNTTYETSDHNGARSHRAIASDGVYMTSTITYSPPFALLPPNPAIGSTYSFSGSSTMTSADLPGTPYPGLASLAPSTTAFNNKFHIAGFESISNYAGTQSWIALKVIGTYDGYTSTTWYVDGIGAVQWQSNPFGTMETWKLTSTNVIPFAVAVTSTITATSATVATKITFKPTEVGNSGEVYVTAVAPQGSLPLASGTATARSVARAGSTTQYVLYQLTSTGWQPVVNGALIPYASGVLGDALAAQSILDNTDPTNLKGAQFCVGYGKNAAEMAAAGRMQSVATIPDPTATSTAPPSCLVGLPLSLTKGWNLVGNSLGAALDVASAFGDATTVATVWKWNAATAKWAFFAPSLTGQALIDFAAGKGYEVLSAIHAGEGFWVNATSAFATTLPLGAPVTASTFQNMGTGWNLIAVGESPTPSAFNKALSLTPPAVGDIPGNVVTLWAWDSSQGNWYFYAPSLEKSGGLSSHIESKKYLSFGTKSLDPTTGFWVNR